MVDEFKPCPFCGGEAELVQENDHAWVRHKGCPADIGGFECAVDAVAAWNRRAALASAGEPVTPDTEIQEIISDLHYWSERLADIRQPQGQSALKHAASILSALAPHEAPAEVEPATRLKVPEGQTPLNDDLSHKLLGVFAEGAKARENGTGSPYHGHSLEHCLHASGWVQRDLRLALDAAMSAHPPAPQADVAGWRPIETAPKDGTVIQAWHKVHQCPMSIFWKDEGFPFNGERLHWYERSYTTAWPEKCFTHWQPLPSTPTKGESDA